MRIPPLPNLSPALLALLLCAALSCDGTLRPAPPPGDHLLYDDFAAAEPHLWTPYAGTWDVRGAELEAGRKVLNQTVAGSLRWTDYQVQARVTLRDDDGKVGLLGRVQGTHHYYELLLARLGDQRGWMIRRRVDHTWDTLATGAFDYRLGVPYVLRFELRGDRLAASVSADGESFERLGEVTDGTFKFGKMGLASYFARSSFDDVTVDGELAFETGPWGGIVELRDDTATFPTGKPAGGWYVTAIHGTLRANDGKVLLTGFGRKAEANCTDGAGGTQRETGTTFLVDPAAIEALNDGDNMMVQPLNEQNLDPAREVLYCAGHNTLADGRIFFSAGTRYPSILPNSNPELGLAYSRVYSPLTNSLTRISANMAGGQSVTPGMKWYPTNLLMPDSRVLMFGGFHWSGGGAGTKGNHSLELFDPAVWDTNPTANPYTVLTQHSEGSSETPPTRGYTNLFLLPKPVPAASAGGFARSTALMGGVGRVFLFNHEPGPTGAQRLLARTNALIPNPSGTEKGEGASGVMLPDGRLMFSNGGHDGAGAARVYFYNPYTDAWTTLDTGISRMYGNALWLPDGTVLIVNGYVSEPGNIGDVTNPLGGADGVRKPQIIDPFANTVSTQPAWPEPTGRGYHSFAVLLKDGRVLIGGGKDGNHATGCEKNELRIYTPPYLMNGQPRPAITNVTNGRTLSVAGANLTINYTGTVRATRGVVLMAPGSVTHAFDEGQRYVPLTTVSGPSGGAVTVAMPASINEAQPGDYVLYVISDQGVPSVGVHVRLLPPAGCLHPMSTDAYLEAERPSRRAGPFSTVNDGTRSAGAYLQVSTTTPATTTVPDEGRVAWYDVDLSTAGSYFVWLLANGPTISQDSFYVSVDGQADQTFNDLSPNSWGWRRGSAAFTLAAGKHQLKVKVREPGVKLDKIWLTTNTTTTPPSGFGNAAVTCRGAGALQVNDTSVGTDTVANNAQWSILPAFGGGAGQLAFGDRTYTIAALPAAAAHLAGKPWIRPSADSRHYTATTPPLGTAVVNGSFVYIAVDNRHTTTFLTNAGFTSQGYSFTVNEGATPRTYAVFRKAVTAGSTLTLPTMQSIVAPTYLTIIE